MRSLVVCSFLLAGLVVCCADVGGWTEWSEYGICSKECGGGVRYKVRTCTNPPPSRIEDNCQGPQLQSDTCNPQACPVNGGWTDWSEYTPCPRECGENYQVMMRNCTNPAPAGGGSCCSGQSSEKLLCQDHHDCDSLAKNGRATTSGFYCIHPTGGSPVTVYCDVEHGRGWTVIQKNMQNSNGIQKIWESGWDWYKNGFGDWNLGVFWIGLEHMHRLTARQSYILSVEVVPTKGGQALYGNYSWFRIEGEEDKYTLRVSGYTGNLPGSNGGDMFLDGGHSGMKFSTFAQENNGESGLNCAERFQGGWWYNRCHRALLNGRQMMWDVSLVSSTMMILPV